MPIVPHDDIETDVIRDEDASISQVNQLAQEKQIFLLITKRKDIELKK